jgi:uncharacterized protein YkwD
MKTASPVIPTAVRLAVLAGLVIVFLTACNGLFDRSGVRVGSLPAEAKEFVELVNEHRESEGLSALEWHPEIAGVALAHTEDMRDREFFAHDNPDGESPFDRLSAAGISYSRAGENIAAGQQTGQAVLDAWLGSPGHRANIENEAYTHHGVGYVEDGHYWTHVFATDPSVEE